MNHASFRKSWNARHLTPVALAVTAVFMLAGCEQSDETVSMYQNADDCSAATGKAAECTTAYNSALKEAERTAPKYASREDCVAEFGEGQCQQAPAQAGMAPENQAQAQSSGSFWMPLMAGYMMGRMMSGGAGYQQQPLFSSKTQTARHTVNTPTPPVKTTVQQRLAVPRPYLKRRWHLSQQPPAPSPAVALVNLWRNKAPCSAAQPGLRLAQWAADYGTSQYCRAPGLARKSH